MNTKHFLTATVLIAGLFFTSLNADAQRNRRNDRQYDRNDNRDNYRGNDRNHRYIYHHRGRIVRPPVVCLPPVRPHYVRRHVRCAAPVCYAPPRRGYHHRWHR